MSREAERWLAEQEKALLETIHELDSPPEPEEAERSIRLEVHRGLAADTRASLWQRSMNALAADDLRRSRRSS